MSDRDTISNKDTIFGITDSNPFSKKEIVSGAKKVSCQVHGGPGSGKDIRMYIDRLAVQALVEAVRWSPQKRAQLNNVGIEINTWVRPDGTHFEVWKLFSAPPKSAM